MIDTDKYEAYCYKCNAKINTSVIGYKGNPRGSTRIEAFCDEECRYYAGYGDTCCSLTTCNCGEPIGRGD